MFKNYIKIALRNMNKNRAYAIINILGLALGLMVGLIVYLYVTEETNYEKHIKDYEQIYRVGLRASMMGQDINAPVSCSPMAESLRNDFAEVVTATRSRPMRQEVLLKHEETRIYIDNGARADSVFFKIFDYAFVHGDPQTALKEDNAMVLTEATARKFFGDENPMDKIINYDNRRDYIVRGVVREPAGNSHFRYDFFISDNDADDIWISNNYYTYLKLREGADPEAFMEIMTERFFEKIAPQVEMFLKVTIEEFFAQNNEFAYDLQPIQDIHLHSQRDWEIQQNGNVIYIYVFIGIAFLVLLIAGINFMNLATARSAKRAKEVGIRKVSGATRGMLIRQFLMESVIQSFIALFLALILVELFLSGFNNIMDSNLSLINDHFFKTLAFALGVTLLYGLFSGSYPAFFLSRFQPVSVLKGDMSKTKGGTFFRKTLVVVQFTGSIILIIGMIIIFSQISYMHNKDLGFEGEQVLVVPIQTDKVAQNFRTYKKEFLQNPQLVSASRASFYPGDAPNQTMFELEGREEQLPLWNMGVDFDIFETLGLELVEGEKFNEEIYSDSTLYYIFNETAVRDFNIENPVGKRLMGFLGPNERSVGTIIGVVKDFHVEGFNQPIRPMVLYLDNNLYNAAFKIAAGNMNETIDYIETKWNEIEPTHPFRYTFLDDKYGALLESQSNFGKIFLYLTILAIIIAAMGLYGLASYTAEQRTKEIGIRKVLGASVPQLMKLLSKDFVILVLIANLFAWPITFILAKNWLSRFSYQIDVPIMPFIFASVLAFVIALLTVSYQAYQAAVSDPVIALKYE